VLFAYGTGSSRRNQYVARMLEYRHLATLLIDLLTPHDGVMLPTMASHGGGEDHAETCS
jgi:hypothetical protein